MENVITEEMLAQLRERVRAYLDERRYLHTLEVEEEAARIGAVFLPDKIEKLRAAALLHDITKRDSFEKQLQYCEEFGIMIDKAEFDAPQVLHAVTAAAVAARDFADIVDEEILGGIRWHTTGHDGMSVFESVIFLADYIEPSRTFDDCISMRNYFWGSMPNADDRTVQAVHLCRSMVYAFDLTMRQLLDEAAPIGTHTVLARNCFLDRLAALTEA
ncbi:MAG: HD domain-containing protein [Ruminococcaceae bacterium]|nr:HD domain-containing protein [Oscillospiraceae bacterium]